MYLQLLNPDCASAKRLKGKIELDYELVSNFSLMMYTEVGSDCSNCLLHHIDKGREGSGSSDRSKSILLA